MKKNMYVELKGQNILILNIPKRGPHSLKKSLFRSTSTQVNDNDREIETVRHFIRLDFWKWAAEVFAKRISSAWADVFAMEHLGDWEMGAFRSETMAVEKR